jgi:hypothetical protein
MLKPPTYPWKRGQQPRQGNETAYEALSLEVEVCLDEMKQVYSSHKPLTGEDQELAMTWPGGGQEHIGFALLVEAARREAILSMLINMTNKPGFIASLAGLSEEKRQERLAEMALVLRHTMNSTLEGIAQQVVEEAYQTMVQPS